MSDARACRVAPGQRGAPVDLDGRVDGGARGMRGVVAERPCSQACARAIASAAAALSRSFTVCSPAGRASSRTSATTAGPMSRGPDAGGRCSSLVTGRSRRRRPDGERDRAVAAHEQIQRRVGRRRPVAVHGDEQPPVALLSPCDAAAARADALKLGGLAARQARRNGGRPRVAVARERGAARSWGRGANGNVAPSTTVLVCNMEPSLGGGDRPRRVVAGRGGVARLQVAGAPGCADARGQRAAGLQRRRRLSATASQPRVPLSRRSAPARPRCPTACAASARRSGSR